MKNIAIRILILTAFTFYFENVKADIIYEIDGIHYHLDEYDSSKGYGYAQVAQAPDPSPRYIYSGDIVIPDTVVYNNRKYCVRYIEDEAFYGSYEMSSIVLPKGLLGIGDQAFRGCWGLTEITIPRKVLYIYSLAFANCKNLQTLRFEDSSETLTFHISTGDIFKNCPLKTLYLGRNLSTIANNVSIGLREFWNKTTLESVEFGDSITIINNYAFDGCSGITSIRIPKNIKVAWCAFSGCSQLKNMIIDDSDEGIVFSLGSNCPLEMVYVGRDFIAGEGTYNANDKWAFSNTSTLKEVVFGHDVKNIFHNSFEYCTSLESLVIPNNVVSISDYAFMGCSNLPTIMIGTGLKEIGESAFSGCSNLERAYFPNIGKLCEIEFNGQQANPLNYAHLFIGDEEITDIVIPDSITKIGAYLFAGFKYLHSLKLHSNVTEIGEMALFSCTNLSEIYCYGEDFPLVGINALAETPLDNITLYVHKRLLEFYQTKYGIFKAIEPLPYFEVINCEKLYGDENPTFQFTTNVVDYSGQPVFSCETEIDTPVGEYEIIINKGSLPDGDYDLLNGTLTIVKAPLSIIAGNYSIKQGEPLPEYILTYNGFKNNEDTSVFIIQPSVTCEATSESEPGEYPILVSGGEANNYAFNYVAGKLTITEADPVTLTANSYTIVYGEELPIFSFTSEGAEVVGNPEITCDAQMGSAVGDYDIVISKGSVKNYNDHYVNGTLTITKAPLTASVGNYSRKQGEENPSFTVNYDGWKLGETAIVLTTRPNATTTATTDSSIGDYPIIVSGGEAQNYEFNYVAGILTITEADPVTLTANSYTIEYGEEIPALGFTSEGAEVVGEPAISCEARVGSSVGMYDIVISKGAVKNYNDHYVNGTLTITKAPLTVSVDNYSREFGQENPSFDIHYEGWKLEESEGVLISAPSARTTATADSPVGEYPITVSGGEAQNYNFIYVDGILTVTEPTGIAKLLTDARSFDVYTITGIKIRSEVTTLKGLPRGIYIINNKKVSIK